MERIKKVVTFIKTHKYIAFGALGAVVLLLILVRATDKNTEERNDSLPIVSVTSALEMNGNQTISVVGSVRAFSEVVLTTETSGRVTSVNATLGQTVPAGFVLATLENASERAAVLQAEGVYEAALASAQQSTLGVSEAKTNLTRVQNNALSTFENAYNTVSGAVRNNIDTFFANPDAAVPGLRINGKGNTAFLNNERVKLQNTLPSWQQETITLSTDSDLKSALREARSRVENTIVIVDTFLSIFNGKDPDRSYTDAELTGFSSTFTNLRATLQATKTSINNDIASLENAEDALRRAEIGGGTSANSAADAQVKQALGALRAAQANLAQTILQTPISGTVNSINVRVGDFVGNQFTVARVANNSALEVITYVGDKELIGFPVGGNVIIEDTFEGIVTEVAPAVDPLTKKTEVRIAVETDNIQNGDTVTIKTTLKTGTETNQTVVIPLSAVKFEIANGFVFTVAEGRLTPREIEIGVVRGGSVEVTSGLSLTDEFVIDARGLLPNTEVEVRRN